LGFGGNWGSDLSFGGFDGVPEEHGDSEGADATRDGGEPAGDFVYGIEINVADGLFFAGGVFDSGDADIDDDGAGFDHIGFDEAGDAGGGDEDVGFFGEGG